MIEKVKKLLVGAVLLVVDIKVQEKILDEEGVPYISWWVFPALFGVAMWLIYV